MEGKTVSAGSSVLSDMVQCNQLRRERFVGCMAGRGGHEQCSPSRGSSGDNIDGASVEKEWGRKYPPEAGTFSLPLSRGGDFSTKSVLFHNLKVQI